MMKTIQIVIEEDLLTAVTRAARKAKINRSALTRLALRDFLGRAKVVQLEAQHRAGYEQFPAEEFDIWDKVAAWPEE